MYGPHHMSGRHIPPMKTGNHEQSHMAHRLVEKPEIISELTKLLQRKKSVFIHGNRQNKRRYLHAGDAAQAFNTILHKGQIGEESSVDSLDEMSNLNLATKLLGMFDHHADTDDRIEYARDRPFNDLRYAIDASKPQNLGWKQRTAFEEGLRHTMVWHQGFQKEGVV